MPVQLDTHTAEKRAVPNLLVLVICATALAAALLYGLVIAPRIEAHDKAVERQGFKRGVAYAGRKCWYHGYFMDGTQRYECKAGEEK
jgi:hypothetical protein